jgi:putative transposase
LPQRPACQLRCAVQPNPSLINPVPAMRSDRTFLHRGLPRETLTSSRHRPEPRRRSEQAIVAVVVEAYVNSVSTRKVDRLGEQLGIEGMTKDRVSALCRNLDEQVELFRGRPLERAYPNVWLDAKHVKVRDHGRVVSMALVVAYAVQETGPREVIGMDIGEVESGSFWVEFLRGLNKRGLPGVSLQR